MGFSVVHILITCITFFPVKSFTPTDHLTDLSLRFKSQSPTTPVTAVLTVGALSNVLCARCDTTSSTFLPSPPLITMPKV